MAGTLSVQTIQGLATAADPTTVSIASGHTLKPSSDQIAQEKYYTYGTRTTFSSSTLVELFPSQTFVKKYDASTSYLFLQAQCLLRSGWSYASAPYINIDSGTLIFGYASHIDTANAGTNATYFNKAVQILAPLTGISAGSHTFALYLRDYDQTYYNGSTTVIVNPTNSDDVRYPPTNYSVMTIKEIMI